MRLRNGFPDRRRHERGTSASEPSRSRLVSMILGTFREMPGLSLHINQAARLFGLRQSTCAVVMDDLVVRGRLRRAADGQYLLGERADALTRHPVPPAAQVARGLVRRGY